MYAAIDALADKLDRQVLKHKEKQNGHRHEPGAIKRTPAPRRRQGARSIAVARRIIASGSSGAPSGRSRIPSTTDPRR